MIVSICSGGFDPIHSGHIKYLEHAREISHKLIVGVNSDEWLQRKKGMFFLPYIERVQIVQALRAVDQVLDFDDTDNTALDLIFKVKNLYPTDRIYFLNGGDRGSSNTPEILHPDTKSITFLWGVGGENKINSSSSILSRWTNK